MDEFLGTLILASTLSALFISGSRWAGSCQKEIWLFTRNHKTRRSYFLRTLHVSRLHTSPLNLVHHPYQCFTCGNFSISKIWMAYFGAFGATSHIR